ncbi:MAG: alpha/beta fold hydrolase [Nitrospiraceae bacterium]
MTVPTLLVTGSQSPKLYGLVIAELDACLPNSQRVVLAGASHGLQIEQPTEFNREVMQFLQRSGKLISYADSHNIEEGDQEETDGTCDVT